MTDGKAQYNCLINESGGIIDDSNSLQEKSKTII